MEQNEKMSDNQFIIEEFFYYKVFLYGRTAAGEKTDYSIQLNLPSGKAILRFTRDFAQENTYEKIGDEYKFYVYLRAEKYPAFIDILRYEKPLFFFYNFQSNESYMTTSDEPVGEEEPENG